MATNEMMEKVKITTTEMHTGGEPLRIIESGYPPIKGKTILDKRRYIREHLDHLRKMLMFEPRGHYDMYGVILVEPDHPDADLAVLFMHNEGYSLMCGHAVVALGRYAIDKGIVTKVCSPETVVNIQCPCGLVKANVKYSDGKTEEVRFLSVPCFAFALDIEVNVPGYGKVNVDIGYGGCFYGILPAQRLGLDINTATSKDIIQAAWATAEEIRRTVVLSHPDSEDLAYLYGVILTNGKDQHQDDPFVEVCMFANKQIDRSPCGSGVTAICAVNFARKQIDIGQTRTFKNGLTGSTFKGKVVNETRVGESPAVQVEVSGKGHYIGSSTFTLEKDDRIGQGFLLR